MCTARRPFSRRNWRKRAAAAEKKRRIRLLSQHGCLICDRQTAFILQQRRARINVNRVKPTNQIISWKDIFEIISSRCPAASRASRAMSYKLKALGKLVARMTDDDDDRSPQLKLRELLVPNHDSVIKFAPKCDGQCCESSSDTNDSHEPEFKNNTESNRPGFFENMIKSRVESNSKSESKLEVSETTLKRKLDFLIDDVENNHKFLRPRLIGNDSIAPMVSFCSRCGYAFANSLDLKTHECSFTPSSPCVVCGVLVAQNVYGEHLIAHDNDILEKAVHMSGDIKCVYCLKSFDNKTALLVHYRSHIAQFQCASCKGHFFNAQDLQQHVLKEHNRVEHQLYHCYICSRRFAHQEAIVNHMRLHSHEMPYTCKECGRSFSQIGNLQRHINTHRGERPYLCQQCGSKFTDPATLRNHSRIHSGELPYVCEVCDRGFTQVGNLKRHMAKHVNSGAADRPFRCPQCGQGFAHESTLRNHFRTHTGEQPYKCTLCKRAFSQIGNLKRHMAKHAAVQDFLCGACNRCFASSTDLIHHFCLAAQIKDDAEIQGNCCMITPWPSNSNYQAGSPDSSGHSIRTTSESSSCDTDHSDGVQNSKIATDFVPNSDEDSNWSSVPVNRTWRVFPCKECDKVFAWKHDLKIHFRTHSGEKPYQCDICFKTFAQSGAIGTHKKRHHPNVVTNN